MDIVVRFWANNQVQTRYLTSMFLGEAAASDLLQAITNVFSTHGLNLKKMIQVSMDGPNVNKKEI